MELLDKKSNIKYSIIIPVFNEDGSLPDLCSKLENLTKKLIERHEIIFVNDGSTDNSYEVIKKKCMESERIRAIDLTGHLGQSYAIQAGVDFSSGDIVITLDGDLQNDPEDIPKLIDRLNKGYDVVCGWRYKRMDPWIKKLSSGIANSIRRLLLGEEIHDVGCTLRAYKRSVLKDINLFGEWHRFLTAIFKKKGYKICEERVNHYPRRSGRSKYGVIKRTVFSSPYLFKLVFSREIKMDKKRQYKAKEITSGAKI